MNVPRRELNFIGREEHLEQLRHLLFESDRPPSITQAAIFGFGGIGKTSLAVLESDEQGATTSVAIINSLKLSISRSSALRIPISELDMNRDFLNKCDREGEVDIQQPKGDDRPELPVTAVSTLGIARLDVSVIVEVATHGDADEVGVGTTMSGLRPAPLTSVVAGGVVPSVNTDPVTVLEPSSGEAVLLTEKVATGAVGVGLQKPDMFDVPNEDVMGSGATEGVDEGANSVVVGVLVMMVVAVPAAELVIPVAGHSVIAPREVPGIGPKVPGLSCTAPNGLPVAPPVGIVPGTAVGDVRGVVVDDVVGLAGARRVLVDPTWAIAVPQPIKTTANIVRIKRCIKASVIAVERPLSISD